MKLFVKDTQLNISSAYLRPGFPFGGSCLGKDTSVLDYQARNLGLDTPVISSIHESNKAHTARIVQEVKSFGCKKIGIIGIAFKKHTDDMRGSPMIPIINKLLEEGYDIKIYDDIVNESDVANWPEIAGLFTNLDDVLSQEVIVRDQEIKCI